MVLIRNGRDVCISPQSAAIGLVVMLICNGRDVFTFPQSAASLVVVLICNGRDGTSAWLMKSPL